MTYSSDMAWLDQREYSVVYLDVNVEEGASTVDWSSLFEIVNDGNLANLLDDREDDWLGERALMEYEELGVDDTVAYAEFRDEWLAGSE